MPQGITESQRIAQRIRSQTIEKDFLQLLKARNIKDFPLPEPIPASDGLRETYQLRIDVLKRSGIKLDQLLVGPPGFNEENLKGNIENYIGWVQMPLGVIGPVRINGVNANGDFYVPLATTEGALVASYNRGAKIISLSGGASAVCLTDTMNRAPCFLFNSMGETGLFINWVIEQFQSFKEIAEQTSRYGKLKDIKTSWNSDCCYLTMDFETGDAAGQNMVTVATDAICRWIGENSPIKPRSWFLEGNMCGDKKAAMSSYLGGRGKKVVTEVIIPKEIVNRLLQTTPEVMVEYVRISTAGASQSGTIGMHGHYSNAIAAIFIACGQDAACVAEASVGQTQMRVDINGDLHVTVSLPNLPVGTIGGGTRLPSARECLEMKDCFGPNRARKFAEIVAVTAMAGEISIIGALCAGNFGTAHAKHRYKGT